MRAAGSTMDGCTTDTAVCTLGGIFVSRDDAHRAHNCGFLECGWRFWFSSTVSLKRQRTSIPWPFVLGSHSTYAFFIIIYTKRFG